MLHSQKILFGTSFKKGLKLKKLHPQKKISAANGRNHINNRLTHGAGDAVVSFDESFGCQKSHSCTCVAVLWIFI